MLTWFLNPWMLLGGLAIAAPILIHLLNKRRFKVVEWAAMDFLFEADKKNRRRVQLENFILLLLRCLAVLLLALLLARPFLPSSVSNVLQNAQRFERVILIDDSLSQRVLTGTVPAMQVATKSVRDLVTDLSNMEDTEEYLTVMLTSQPDQPLLANEPLNGSTIANLVQTLDELECSDQVADYRASLEQMRQYVSGQADGLNRVAYVMTDMRQRDWSDEAASGDPLTAPNALLNEVAELTAGCFVVDVGGSEDGNLAITSVRPDSLQAADKVIRFLVDVSNLGSQTVQDVRLLMQVNENQPDYEVLASLAPGETKSVAFRHVFNRRSGDSFGEDEEVGLPFVSYQVKVEIDRQSLNQKALAADQLLEDSRAIFAARVMDGIPVLLVDGDPSAAAERSETHYLRSVGVLGTGLNIDVVTVSEFETQSLPQYSVIFLCNVDEASLERVASLEKWVADGGSLVFMPGNRVRAETFNQAFYKDGRGLSPLQLVAMAGDPTMASWVNFEVDPQIHPSLQMIVESDASSLGNVDVFSWWTSQLNESLTDAGQTTVSVPLRLTDTQHSAAMVDRSWGLGDVIVFTIPGDGDWSMWPSSPTFAPVMIDLVDYLVGRSSDEASVAPGGTIKFPVDVTRYSERVALRNPSNERVEAIARPADDSEAAKQSGLYQVAFDAVREPGFYSLELKRRAGGVDQVLFASNLDDRESQLTRMTLASLEGDFFSDRVKRVSVAQLGGEAVSGANSEIWMPLLLLLFGVLVLEQFLGWFWGRNR